MNSQIQPYHFAKNPGKDFTVFFEKVIKCKGIVCFDFEDSISSKNITELIDLKNSHRKTLLKKLKEISSGIELNEIGFRINGTETSYYIDDLQEIGTLGSVNCVFLPKVENNLQVSKLIRDLPHIVKEIIPIIETKKGFENIKNILSVKHPKFLKVAFGHCDFNLSNHYFPFFHQDSDVYWDWVKQLVAHTELAGKQLINSPVLNLDDGQYFSQILMKNKSFRNITGQITLCLKQTLLCAKVEFHSDLPFISKVGDKICKSELAKKTIEIFEKYIIEDRFFAVNENRYLICPQEYESAKIVLREFAL